MYQKISPLWMNALKVGSYPGKFQKGPTSSKNLKCTKSPDSLKGGWDECIGGNRGWVVIRVGPKRTNKFKKS